jgi:hypothetical protein
MSARLLTLDGVPAELLVTLGMRKGTYGSSYGCTEPGAVLLPVTGIRGPMGRKLNQERLVRLLVGIREGHDIPAMPVYPEPGATWVWLLDGRHRLCAAIAVGLRSVPCILESSDTAEAGYRFSEQDKTGWDFAVQ